MSSPSTPDGGSSNNNISTSARPSRYESQKRRDWHTFGQYLRNHRPPLELSRCSGAHVLEFLRYLDQFGKTKVHTLGCPFFGQPNPPAPCPCPLKQAWGSLDALVGRLRAAYEENGGTPETNPFGARAVRLFLREVRDSQAKARGMSYEKKKRKRPPVVAPPVAQLDVVNAQDLVAQRRQGVELNLSDVGYGFQFNERFTARAGSPVMPDISRGEGAGEDGGHGGIMTLPVLHCAYI